MDFASASYVKNALKTQASFNKRRPPSHNIKAETETESVNVKPQVGKAIWL
jgi:hypothetical protein